MQLALEFMYATVLFFWVLFIVYPVTRFLYNWMVKRGISHVKAVYYNRKIIHMATGGFIALLVPFLFETPYAIIPMVAILAVLTYIPHRTGKLLYWFQTEDNMYEVHFIISWGVVMTLAWLLFNGNWWYGVIPVAFMSFGDGVTGIVRNILYNKRTKAWIGNLAMACVAIPLGYAVFGVIGGIAGLVASIVEHFESNPIDDNITVPLISFLIIVIGEHLIP
ncbi:MAG: dolichol kinase [Thermoprotei archaeon]